MGTNVTDHRPGSGVAATGGGARVRPGTRAEIGRLNEVTVRVLGLATGARRPGLFATLARHRRLYRPWLAFAGALMLRGAIPRPDAELVILRVAARTGCDYERHHHEHLARRAGLTETQIAAALDAAVPAPWTPRQAALLAATDELHETRSLTADGWRELVRHLSRDELLELPLLVGHYEMLAMALNSFEVPPDEGRPGRLARLLTRLAVRSDAPTAPRTPDRGSR